MTSLAQPPARPETAPRTVRCDGVVCFGGEDWWYHNRGHFDMQMMRELSAVAPVLYVNSIGMRIPRVGEGAMFVRRIVRKLKSLRRGLVKVRQNFSVLSPLALPGRVGAGVSDRALAWQVRRAARSLGIERPLVWVACPPAVGAVEALDPAALVHQRTDRFEEFSHVNRAQIIDCDRRLKARADLTLFCSRSLHQVEGAACRDSLFVDHGVDYEVFRQAGELRTEPAGYEGVGRPRIGFIGGVDAHTFDPPLFLRVAELIPEAMFVLVGGCSLPEGWCTLPNVRFVGRVPYDEVAQHMAAMDVLIMPWNASDWIKACNPVKLKEYLAVGRPVVSTPFDELDNYRGLVRIARDAQSFADEVRAALSTPHDPAPGRERVARESWAAKAAQARARLATLGVEVGGTSEGNR